MTDSLAALSLRQRYEINNALRAGDKIKAIKLFREATGCDLLVALSNVDKLAEQLRTANPYAFRELTERRSAAIKWAGYIVSAAIIAMLFDASQSVDFNRFQPSLVQPFEAKHTATAMLQKALPQPAAVAVAQLERIAPQINPPDSSSKESDEQPYRSVIPDLKELDIAKLYRKKLANPDYLRWLDMPGLPQGYQDYPEEHAIKYARARIAAKLRAPANASIAAIPQRQGLHISIDGIIDALEWQGARRVELLPQASGSALYLLADAEWLYIACDVPRETTADGFDQLRVYFHIDIDPAIRNERIHLGRYEQRLGGIRETTVLRAASRGNNAASRRNYPLSDWQIFRMARGATTLRQHRQYEAKIHLTESGLHAGIPFPAFVEVETDPLKENGNFKQRLYLGTLGSQHQPVWWVIL